MDGQRIAIGPETDVRGTIEVGADVEVDALVTGDGIVARKVRVREDEPDEDKPDEPDAAEPADGPAPL